MRVLLAEYASPEALVAAGRATRDSGREIVDAFTPFPVAAMGELLPETDRGVRLAMLVGGALAAICCYALEWWTAVVNYPFDSGGRPLDSWPVFLLFPFEIGVLGAAVFGVLAFFYKTGLPALHHPVFECELHRRSHVDGFLLAVREPEERSARDALRALLLERGATATREAEL